MMLEIALQTQCHSSSRFFRQNPCLRKASALFGPSGLNTQRRLGARSREAHARRSATEQISELVADEEYATRRRYELRPECTLLFGFFSETAM